jgi:hypothetical protein
MRSILKLAVAVCAAVSCAVEAPPPGGPIDETPPKVVTTVPARDSAGVAPGSSIAITFGEKMTRAGVTHLFVMSPPIEIGTVHWKGSTVFIQPLDSLNPDTTYFATLRAGYRDNHKVASKKDYSWAFATSAAIDSGTISGTVYFSRKPTAKGVARCFQMPVDSAFVVEAARPDREARTDEVGHYALSYLPNKGSRFIVWAFEDQNQNGEFDPGNDYGAAPLDTVTLTARAPFAAGVDFSIVNPKEPATVAGKVINRSGIDTIAVTVTLTADTVETPSYLTKCDTTGAYIFNSVMMGKYVLRAFVDVNADSLCDSYPCSDDSSGLCPEPCTVMPDTLTIAPGAELELGTLPLNPPEKSGSIVP